MRAKLIKGGGFSPPNTWSVLLDGWRHVIIYESYAVAAAVEHAINHPEQWEASEAYEIADRIRAEGTPSCRR